jgi:hypothetical protein
MAITNLDKVSFAETWATMTHSWSSEIRTWAQVISLFSGFSKPITVFANTSRAIGGYLWVAGRAPWTEIAPWLDLGNITNVIKPL